MTAAAEPLRLSWSHLRTHDECPAKYPLMREHKSPLTDVRGFFHGNVVDLAMRRWLSQSPPQPGWMAAQVSVIFDEALKSSAKEGVVRWKHANDRAETLEFCRELLTRLEPILAKYCLPFDWRPAVRFSAPVRVAYLDGTPRTVLLVGEMDLKVRDSQKRVAIWDLKGTRDNQYYRKVLGQLSFYALAERLMTGSYPAMMGLIQPMCDQQVLPVAVDEDAVRQMAGRIQGLAHDIWAGRLAPKASDEGCTGLYGCPVQRACPKFAMPASSGRMSLAAAR